MSHNCRWVLQPNMKNKNGEFVQAVYCERKVSYRMVKDDDGYPVRKYDAFCEEHKNVAQEMDTEY